jgi:hypothetical protein
MQSGHVQCRDALVTNDLLATGCRQRHHFLVRLHVRVRTTWIRQRYVGSPLFRHLANRARCGKMTAPFHCGICAVVCCCSGSLSQSTLGVRSRRFATSVPGRRRAVGKACTTNGPLRQAALEARVVTTVRIALAQVTPTVGDLVGSERSRAISPGQGSSPRADAGHACPGRRAGRIGL